MAVAIGACFVAFVGACMVIAFGGDGNPVAERADLAEVAAASTAATSAVAVTGVAQAVDDTAAPEPSLVTEVEAPPGTETEPQTPASTSPVPVEAASDPAAAAEEAAPARTDLPPSPPSPPGAPDIHSVSAGGVLFMRGTLPSEELRDQIVAAVEQVMGPGNAISEHTIDPSAPYTPGASNPVYVAEKVLFSTGSPEIAEPFYPLLAPLPILQQVQPNVVVTITGHTDSVGSSAGNLRLSQERVDAVRDWVLAQGGDPERLIAVGVGDAEPIADNATPEGRALNRRVEFLIAGFDATVG